MSETETQKKNHVYQDYGASDNVYAEYELSEEDQILQELNARYNQAYTGLAQMVSLFLIYAREVS